MEIVFLPQALKDREYWKRTGNVRIMRRITDEHRMVYSVSDGMVYVYVFNLRFHYSK